MVMFAASTMTLPQLIAAGISLHGFFPHLLQSFFTSLAHNDFASTSFLTLVHSTLLSHPFCPNLPLESPGSISIHICVELIWGLEHCTPSFLPRPLPHYSSTCEMKLPHVEGGGDSLTGWERATAGWSSRGLTQPGSTDSVFERKLSATIGLMMHHPGFLLRCLFCSSTLPLCLPALLLLPPLFIALIQIGFFYACFFWSPNLASDLSFFLSALFLIILWSWMLPES